MSNPVEPKNGRTTLVDAPLTDSSAADSGFVAPERPTGRQTAGEIAGLLVIPLLIAAGFYYLAFNRFDWLFFVPIVLALVGLLAYVATHPRTMSALFGRRRVQGSLTAFILVALVAAILVLLNVALGYTSVRKDFSTDQTSAISDQTLQVLDRIKKPVTVSILDLRGDSTTASSVQTAENLLREYKVRNGNINYTAIDANANPGAAQQLLESNNAADTVVTVFQLDKNIQRVSNSTDEASYTGALIKLLNPNPRTVTFLTGHGELGTAAADQSATSAATLKQLLTDNNYKVSDDVNISSNAAIDPAAILILDGPNANYSDADKTRIVTFLKAGGKALVLQASTALTRSSARSNINDVLSQFNVQFQNGLTYEGDPQSVLQGQASYFYPTQSSSYPNASEQIVKGLTKTPPILIQPDGIVQVDPKKTDTTFTPLIQSSSNSFLCLDLAGSCQSNGQIQFSQGRDKNGPITVVAEVDAAAATTPAAPGATPTPLNIPTVAPTANTTPGATAAPTATPAATATPSVTVNPVDAANSLKQQNSRTRLVLIGTAATSIPLNQQGVFEPGNKTLMLNALNWLSQSADSALTIPTHDAQSRPITLTEAQGNLVRWGSIFLLPIIVLAIGVGIWWRRR